MGKSTNQRVWDTHVADSRPDKNYGYFRKLGVWTSAPGKGTSIAYMSFARPFPLGAKILQAKLRFRTYAMPESGNHTINLRVVTERFAFGRVTWNTRPSLSPAAGPSVTKTGALPAGELWEFDITQIVQAVSDGAGWWGLRLGCTDAVPRWIFSEDFGDGTPGRPTVTIEWSDQPDEPASLSPDEGVVGTPSPALTFDYIPIDEDASMQMVHVQTSTSESFSSPTWDSGQQAWTEPTVYLSQLGYPGAAVGQKVYWRIRVMDQGGWSGWSPVAEFTYHPEPGLTMTAPTGTTTPIDGGDSVEIVGFITDSTPQVSWTSPGQVEYQVTVAEHGASYSARDWTWNTGRVSGTQTSLEIPEGVITRDDVPYRIIVRAWDNKPRIAVANDQYTYSAARCIVTLTDDPALQKVVNVTATQVPRSPSVQVTWQRPTAADEYMVVRDGLNDIGSSRRHIAGKVTHEDAIQPDGSLAWVDHTAPPRTPFRYSIYPVTNGKRGEGTLGDAVTTRLDGVWLVTPTFSVMLAGDDQGTWDLPEAVTAHQVVGAHAPTLIRDVHQGFQGSLNGVIVEEHTHQPDLSAQQKRDRFLQIKQNPEDVRLVVADLNIPVRLANMNVYPTPHSDLHYQWSFDFWQTGDFWWERL